jgi:hypothetical protein
MNLFFAKGSIEAYLPPRHLNHLLAESLIRLGERNRVLAGSPDSSRKQFLAGKLTRSAQLQASRKRRGLLHR